MGDDRGGGEQSRSAAEPDVAAESGDHGREAAANGTTLVSPGEPGKQMQPPGQAVRRSMDALAGLSGTLKSAAASDSGHAWADSSPFRPALADGEVPHLADAGGSGWHVSTEVSATAVVPPASANASMSDGRPAVYVASEQAGGSNPQARRDQSVARHDRYSDLGAVVDDSNTEEHELPPTLPPHRLRTARQSQAVARLESWLVGVLAVVDGEAQRSAPIGPKSDAQPVTMASPGLRNDERSPKTDRRRHTHSARPLPFRASGPLASHDLARQRERRPADDWSAQQGGTSVIDVEQLRRQRDAKEARLARNDEHALPAQAGLSQTWTRGEQAQRLEQWLQQRPSSPAAAPIQPVDPLASAASHDGLANSQDETIEPESAPAEPTLNVATYTSVRLALANTSDSLENILAKHSLSTEEWQRFEVWMHSQSDEVRARFGQELVVRMLAEAAEASSQAEQSLKMPRLTASDYVRVHVCESAAANEDARQHCLAGVDLSTEEWRHERALWRMRCQQDQELRRFIRRSIVLERRRRRRSENQPT